ncbi:oxidoreductase [Francisella halioticida]|uniref:Oxidoreductase n=1 Tax=Francisella halioticida TaxID=549298 RepID=A0ABN5AZH2_9GAMM|nr:FAD-binding domain [Francisella halioticida]ASG68192.1 oxidoreductase [Francisella halioticida]BCD90979.1 oxidoreductase [Francisella halioticida]
MRIAINGIGIAGPTLAWWLREYGFEPIIFEKSPEFKSGGHLVDFWGHACEIMEKMGLLEQLRQESYQIKHIHCFDENGRRSSKINISSLIKENYGEFLSVKRGDISSVIYNACKGIDIRFGTSIENLEEQKDGITVHLSNNTKEKFDLVIGADGLHSHIRSLVFDKSEYEESDLNKYIAAFSLKDYNHYEKFTYAISVGNDKQVARVCLDEKETLVMLTIDSSLVEKIPTSLKEKKQLLQSVFKDNKWETPDILARLDNIEYIYFDNVSQVKMDNWYKGRVALVGDASSCPSILMGLGSIFAIVEAYVLAGELYKAKGNYKMAFDEWQNKLKDIINRKQKVGLSNLSLAASDEIVKKYLSTITIKVSSTPIVSKFIGAGIFNDQIELPEYKKD